MATFRMGLLMCGHVHPAATDLGGDYPELFGDLFGPFDVEIVVYDASDGRLPDRTDECDGWITSPARASVNDDEPWIRDLEDLIRDLVATEAAFAGICFGHQLLARALGGRVDRAAVGWGVGVQRYEVVAERWWMDPPAPGATVALVASHEDQVTGLPDGATLLATAPYCPIAAFELGERAIAIQPHPEFTPAISARLLDLREDLIGPDVTAAARATLGRTADRELVARWITRFLRGAGPDRVSGPR